MAQRSITEADAKQFISSQWSKFFDTLKLDIKFAGVDKKQSLVDSAKEKPWLSNTPLVIKPDMLFGGRGKENLVYFKDEKPGDINLDKADIWLKSHMGKSVTLKNGVSGELRRFIVEPFLPHEQSQEYYISIQAGLETDKITVSTEGGVDIEANWEKAQEVEIPLGATDLQVDDVINHIFQNDFSDKETFITFAKGLYKLFRDFHFSYLEINPFVVKGSTIFCLDMVAKIDDTAGYLMGEDWHAISYPSEFGQEQSSPEEKLIKSMDEKSGASLKLTILNPEGRLWTLVAGGGASVVFADTIADTWNIKELANYGEYSGNPTTQETYVYTKTILDLLTRQKHPSGKDKILLIGGAIANFTDVAKTFDGIIQAFNEYAEKMLSVGIRIYVRRGGPNYELGLKNIKSAAKKLKLPIEVYGPETHLTEIVSIAKEDD